MKIKQNDCCDEIHIDDITNEHLVVAIRKGFPVILTTETFEGKDYEFRCLSHGFTYANGYNEHITIKEAVKEQQKYADKIEVFHQKGWKKALRWLINNG